MQIVLEEMQRQAFHASASVEIPAGVSQCTVTVPVHPDDQAAGGKSCRIAVRQSADQGKTWGNLTSSVWTSPNPSPILNFGIPSTLHGRRLRVELDIPDTIGVGASVHFS